MTTDSMIARVARALCELKMLDPDQRIAAKIEDGAARWVSMWESEIPAVRTVLAAMREPTEAMVGDEIGRRSEIMDVMGASIETQHRAMVRDQLIAQWHTMIDAALEDGR